MSNSRADAVDRLLILRGHSGALNFRELWIEAFQRWFQIENRTIFKRNLIGKIGICRILDMYGK